MPSMERAQTPVQARIQKLLKEAEETDLYTDQNKTLILEFVNTCKAKKLSPDRICFYLDRLKQISKAHRKDFRVWDRKDVEFVMAQFGDRYSPWTLECVKTTFKVFYRWLEGLERTDPAPKLVRWLSKENIPTELRKEDLLTKKDIQDMLNATNRPQEKAVIAVLNAGPRPGELLGIRIRDIRELNGLVKIYVKGKMGRKAGERPLYMTEYTEELKAWIRRHPQRHDPEAKLFIGRHGEFARNTLDHVVKRIARTAGITKHINCYRFRHTAGTRYYGKYEGSYARRLMGHAAGSKMEAVYCHLNEEDIEARLLGKALPEDTEPDIPTVEAETQELIAIGTVIKKLSQQRPDILNGVDLSKLQQLMERG